MALMLSHNNTTQHDMRVRGGTVTHMAPEALISQASGDAPMLMSLASTPPACA